MMKGFTTARCAMKFTHGVITSLLVLSSLASGSSFVTLCEPHSVCEPGHPPLAVYQRDGYATLALAIDGVPALYRSSDGETRVPSCVGWAANGEVLVGSDALKNSSSICKVCGIEDIVNFTHFDSVLSVYNISIVDGEYMVTACDAQHSVLDLHRRYLEHLHSIAEDFFNVTIDKAVLVVNSDFSPSPQFRATWSNVYKRSGLLLRRLIAPSVCLARYYNISYKVDEAIYVAIVYGAKVVHISIVDADTGIFETMDEVVISPADDAVIEEHVNALLKQHMLPEDIPRLHSDRSRQSDGATLEAESVEAIVVGASLVANDFHCYEEAPCLCLELLELPIGLRVWHINETCGVQAILSKNMIIPAKKTVQLIPRDEGHESMRVALVHGCNYTLWTRDVPQKGFVDITLEVDISGLLHVTLNNRFGFIIHETIGDGMPRSLIKDEVRSSDCKVNDVCDNADLSYPASIIEY